MMRGWIEFPEVFSQIQIRCFGMESNLAMDSTNQRLSGFPSGCTAEIQIHLNLILLVLYIYTYIYIHVYIHIFVYAPFKHSCFLFWGYCIHTPDAAVDKEAQRKIIRMIQVEPPESPAVLARVIPVISINKTPVLETPFIEYQL